MITEEDISRLIPAFYERVRADPQLGPIFNAAVDDWPHHLERLKAFWSSVILSTGRYKGQPMVVHLRHEQAMTAQNFTRWLNMWRETTSDILSADAAAIFQEKANVIAESLQLGVQFHRARIA
ncbi:group III truncated hemoglobin [Sphingomonas sp.]|uniref:group III truncated hemoglobin n=1 Tax=Sphingomonas sp. TaxID=28214 RepID=UPI00345D9E93